MPAASKKQQQAAGAELAYRRKHGGKKRGKGAAFGTAKLEDLAEFAGTKHQGKPTRVRRQKKHKPPRKRSHPRGEGPGRFGWET